MPSTRRSVLRAGLLGVVGTLAGCSASTEPTTTETARTPQSTQTTTTAETRTTTRRTTMEETTTDESTTATTGNRPDARAIEFVHRSPILSPGITDADTDYFVRLLTDDRDLRALDAGNARGDFPEQDVSSIEQFVAETDSYESSLLVVQRRMSSAEYGLAFGFLDRWAPPRAITRVENRNRRWSDSAVSTLLVRVPASVSRSLTVTAVGTPGEGFDRSVSFALQNRLLSESVNVGPIDRLPDPGGALVGTREDAKRLFADEESLPEFVRATDFGRSYLLAVSTHIQSGGGYVWPRSIVQDRGRVAARIWRQGFTGGPSAEFGRLLLARVPGEVPERGTATIHPAGANLSPDLVRLSSDPAGWPKPSGDKSK